MKRASTLDKHGRHSAEQNAAAAKASLGKEENNVTGDSRASGNSPFKKIKLSIRKDSASARNVSQSEEPEQRPGSPLSSPRKEAENAGQTPQSPVAAMRNASMPVLRNAGSKPSTTTSAALAVPDSAGTQAQSSSGPSQQRPLSPETAVSSRRQQWLEQDKPSFVFEEITDPTLLALFDKQVPALASAATTPQLSDREQARQLQPIANAIKTALEGVLAGVVRKFMKATSQHGVPTDAYQAAHHEFSELIQMFNSAKMAAVDGQEGKMIAELQAISSALDRFIVGGLNNAIEQFGCDKSEKAKLKAELRTLLAQCREWHGEDREEAVRPWSPSFAPSSPQGRQRSVSSPSKANEPWAETESSRINRLSASFPGPISPHPSQHRISLSLPAASATLSPASTPPGSPLASPVQSPKSVASPKESVKPFRLSTLIGSPGSPRSKEASRKESSVKGLARQSSASESTSHSSLPGQHSDKRAEKDKEKAEKSRKTHS